MATNTKNKEWAKSQKDLIVEMVNKGYIDIEDVKAINNKDGAYSIEDQDAAFERIKKDIQKRYSEDRLNSNDAKSVLSKERIEQLRKFRESVDKFDKPTDALLSSKLIEQIKSSGYKDVPLLKGMTEQIKDMSDKDVKEYIYNQRQFLNQMLPGKAVESIPDLQEYMTVQPNYGVKNTNYAKMFNDDEILDKLNEIPFRDIDYIARKNGMSGKELLKDMTDAKIAKDRKLFAHGGRWRDVLDANKYNSLRDNPIASNVGGSLLTLFGRRQQEAIARGEDPKLKDIAGDIGEQLAYMAPVGRIAGPVAKVASRIGPSASKIAASASKVGSNAIVPTASELYDTAVYDKDNPRGEFGIADASFGTVVNAATPYALRRGGSAIGKLTGSKSIQKTWGELAEGKTADEIIKDIQNKYKGVKIQDANNPNVSAEVRRRAQELKSIIEADPDLALTLVQGKPLVFDIAKEPGKNIGEKAKNYVNRSSPDGYTLLDVDTEVNAPTVSELYNRITEAGIPGNAELTAAGKMGQNLENPNVISDRLMNTYDKLGLDAVEAAKSSKELLEEDLIKNYLTNQAGNFIYADKNITFPGLDLLPIDLNRILKEQREKAERKKAMEKSRKRLPTLESLYGNLK